MANALVFPLSVAFALCFPFIGGKSPRGSRRADALRDSQYAASSAADAASAASAGGGEDSTSTSTASFNANNLTYDDPAKLHQQLRQKEKELKKREEENQSLRQQLISKVSAFLITFYDVSRMTSCTDGARPRIIT